MNALIGAGAGVVGVAGVVLIGLGIDWVAKRFGETAGIAVGLALMGAIVGALIGMMAGGL